MIYKIKRNIKKYWILFITFFVINIFIIGIIINIFNLNEELKVNNSLMSKDGKNISFSGVGDISFDNLVEMLGDEKFVIESSVTYYENNEDSPVIGVFYNYDIDKKYPLVEGRMISSNEMKEEKKVALVGYKFIDDISDNNTINVKGEEYNVVGVLGDKEGSILNSRIYINLKSLNSDIFNKSFNMSVVDKKTSDIAGNIYNRLREKEKNINLSIYDIQGNVSPLLDSINTNIVSLVIGILVIICLISTVVNISLYWIKNEKKIIGIKSLVGGTKLKLSLQFWRDYQITIIISIISSFGIWILINRGNIVNNKVLLGSIVVLTILDIVISTLAIIPPCIKLNKIQINSIIKEHN